MLIKNDGLPLGLPLGAPAARSPVQFGRINNILWKSEFVNPLQGVWIYILLQSVVDLIYCCIFFADESAICYRVAKSGKCYRYVISLCDYGHVISYVFCR
jgi:hypothetical protein